MIFGNYLPIIGNVVGYVSNVLNPYKSIY